MVLTVGTFSVESELTALYREPILRADSPLQISFRTNTRKIQNRSATIANKVTVRGNNSVKPFLTLYYTHTLDQPMLLEKGQITVDRSQAQIRMLGLELLIHPFS